MIGGSGLGDLADKVLQNSQVISQEETSNDFGVPSGKIYTGKISGVEVALLSRYKLEKKITNKIF